MLAIGLFILYELAELEMDSTLTQNIVDKCNELEYTIQEIKELL